MKTCSRCKVEKEVSEFCKCARMKDGLQSACKSCMNDSYTRSRQKDQQRYKQVAKDRTTANALRIRKWKEERGCLFCSENFGPCLELHHLDPTQKEFDPSDGRHLSWKTFLKEADKCVVVCANCHRKVHHGVLTIGD